MKRKEFMEQASKIAGLQYDLWRKFPHYVVTDLTLQTDQHGKVTPGDSFEIFPLRTDRGQVLIKLGGFGDRQGWAVIIVGRAARGPIIA